MVRQLALSAFLLAAAASSVSAQRTIAVNVESTPPGATVWLDSAEGEPLGQTPMRRVRIARGTHTLIFRLENHAEAQLPINVRRWNETFSGELRALGVLSITAGRPDFEGAEVRVDGVPQGSIPVRMNVDPGRHLIQVRKEGYVPFSQWAEVAGGQVLTLPVLLEREAPRTGSILVAGDVSGANILIDGTPRGSTPTVVEGLAEGQHTVVVEPAEEGQQRFEQTVLVTAGERAVVHPIMRPAPPTGGTLRVLTNVPAVIRFDGETIGESPATREGIAPGEHILEATAEGYEPVQQPITIEADRQRVVSLTLEPVQLPNGVIVVNVDVDGANVTVDGEPRGSAPIVIEDAQPGTHAVIVEAPGRATYRETCTTAPGEDCRLDVALADAPVDVVFTANVEGATLFVDGEPIGPVPYEGGLPAGSRRIEVRAEGYRTYEAQVQLAPAAEPRTFDVQLVGLGELTEEERQVQQVNRQQRHRQAVARSGAPLDDDYAILDFSIGWPYLFEGRLGIGLLPWLEAGVALRTFVRLTEFEGRVKAGWRIAPQFSAGAQVRIGGGIGPSHGATSQEEAIAMGAGTDAASHNANSFFLSLEGLLSLHFSRAGNFTLWGALDFHSDRWDYNGTNNDCPGIVCNSDGPDVLDASGNLSNDRADFYNDRQNLARFRLGGSLEFIVAQHWNVWGSFEGVFGGNRRVLGDIFGAGNDDLNIYMRLGATYKFGFGQ